MDATSILVIVLVSGFLGFWQEQGAANAIEKLYVIVQIILERENLHYKTGFPHIEYGAGLSSQE